MRSCPICAARWRPWGRAGEKELAAEILLQLLRENLQHEKARLQGQAGEEREPLGLAAAIRLELTQPQLAP